jgi:(p)ppGpp synthase/HD superfamily hydrolase
MRITSRIQQAIDKAAQLHDGQRRKADDLPYIVHPITVAATLLPYTEDEDVILAALLHDVLEDVEGYSESDMRQEYGDRVTDLVLEVTEAGNRPNMTDQEERSSWETRKRSYLDSLERDSREALMICAADKLHNLRATMIAVARDGREKVEKRFHSTFERQLWFYEEVLRLLQERMGGPLATDLAEEVERARKVMVR